MDALSCSHRTFLLSNNPFHIYGMFPLLRVSSFLLLLFLLFYDPTAAAAAWSRTTTIITGWSSTSGWCCSTNHHHHHHHNFHFHAMSSQPRVPFSSASISLTTTSTSTTTTTREPSSLSATSTDDTSSSSSSSLVSNNNHSNLLLNYTTSFFHNNNNHNNHQQNTSIITFYALRHGQSLANQAGIIASNPNIACTNYGLTKIGFAQAESAGQAIWEQLLLLLDDNDDDDDDDDEDSSEQQDQQQQQHHCSYKQIQLVSSDLKRAVETAETVRNTLLRLVAKKSSTTATIITTNTTTTSSTNATTTTSTIQIPPVVLDTRLRERDFGAFDGTSDKNYQQVWDQDALADASFHTLWGVESVHSVMHRSTACVLDWYCKYAQLLFGSTQSSCSSSSSNIAETINTTNQNPSGTTIMPPTTLPPTRTLKVMIVLVAHGDVLQILQTAFLKRNGKYHQSCVEHLETAQLRKLELAE